MPFISQSVYYLLLIFLMISFTLRILCLVLQLFLFFNQIPRISFSVMDVKLIIRAPNQNFDDQIIYCNTDWTVLRLKNHLSEVYPNKPVIFILFIIIFCLKKFYNYGVGIKNSDYCFLIFQAVEEQKLIYSGHLLHDHLQLKEIIRHVRIILCTS